MPYTNPELNDIAQIGDLSALIVLHQQGCDLHADDEQALCDAAYCGCLPIVKYLIEHGADIHAQNEYALFWASNWCMKDIVDYLFRQGANPGANKNAALQDICYLRWTSMARKLIDHGINVTAYNKQALKMSVDNKRYSVIDLLIQNSADIQYQNHSPIRMPFVSTNARISMLFHCYKN